MVSKDFAAGFIAGEGTFTIITQAERGRIYPQFSVAIHKKGKETLDKLQELFGGIGSVYDRTDIDDCFQWRVQNQKELPKVIDVLDDSESFKVTEKYDQYQTWRQIVELYVEKYHTPTENAVEMAELARDELNVGLGKSEESWDEFISLLKE
jgi:hypothetical protein